MCYHVFTAFLWSPQIQGNRKVTTILCVESDHVQVFIKRSKIDQFGEGKPVIISATVSQFFVGIYGLDIQKII